MRIIATGILIFLLLDNLAAATGIAGWDPYETGIYNLIFKPDSFYPFFEAERYSSLMEPTLLGLLM